MQRGISVDPWGGIFAFEKNQNLGHTPVPPREALKYAMKDNAYHDGESKLPFVHLHTSTLHE